MITQTKAYRASDGSFHEKLEDAQQVSLAALFSDMEQVPDQATAIARRILDNQEAVLDLLTTTKRSRPGRRLVNGYPGHKRRAKSDDNKATASAAV